MKRLRGRKRLVESDNREQSSSSVHKCLLVYLVKIAMQTSCLAGQRKRSGFDPQQGVDKWGMLVIVAASISWSEEIQL